MLKKNYDITIIGAGIVGLLTAFFARQRFPNKEIALVDKDIISCGVTHYSIGFEIPFAKTKCREELTNKSSKYWKEIRTIIPDLANRKIHLNAISENDIFKKYFTDESVKEVSKKSIQISKDIAPLILNEKNILYSNMAAFHHDVLVETRQIYQYLQNSIDIIECMNIKDVMNENKLHIIKTEQNNDFISENVIFALGPWTNTLPCIQKSSVSSYCKIKKIVAFHLNIRPKISDESIYFCKEDAFLLPDLFSNKWIFSFTVNEWNIKPTKEQLQLSKSNIELGKEILSSYSSELARQIVGARVFCDAYSEDWNPLIMSVSDLSRAVVITNGSGSGYRLAPAMANKGLDLLFG